MYHIKLYFMWYMAVRRAIARHNVLVSYGSMLPVFSYRS